MFLLESTATAKDVVRLVLEKFDATEDWMIQCCSIFGSSNGSSIDTYFDGNTTITEMLFSWAEKEGAKFVFMIRLFMKSFTGLEPRDFVARRLNVGLNDLTNDEYLQNAEILYPQLLYLQYLQSVYNVITGQYATTAEEALELGALQFLHKFGEYQESRHAPGFLGNRIVEFIPARHLRLKSLEQWEEDFTESVSKIHQNLPARSSTNPQRQYLEAVMKLADGNMYGSTLFRCSQSQFKSMPETLLLGAHCGGITIFDTSKQMLRQYSLMEMSRWGFKRDMLFYMEICPLGDEAQTLEFQTVDGKKIADLLSDYAVEYIAEKNRFEGRNIERRPDQQTKPTKASPLTTTAKVAAKEDIRQKPAPTSPNLPPAPTSPAGFAAKPASAPLPPSVPPPETAKNAAVKKVGSVKELMAANALKAKQSKAAVKIQSLFRGFALRNQWSKEGAIILIQAFVRGYLQRVRLAQMIQEMFENGELG